MQTKSTKSPLKARTGDDTVSQISVAASASPSKRPGRPGFHKMKSSEYESRGLSESNVEGLQVKAVQMELQRERTMNESL